MKYKKGILRALKIIIFFIIIYLVIYYFRNYEIDRYENLGGEEQAAKQVLIDFFSLLVEEKYEEALDVFYPEKHSSMSGFAGNRYIYDWNLIAKHSNFENQNATKAEQLKNYCQITGSCLRVEIMGTRQASESGYSFDAQFRYPNGTIFTHVPKRIKYDSDHIFRFTVKKMGIWGFSRYVVTTPPLDTLK